MSDKEYQELEYAIKIFCKHGYSLKKQCAFLEEQIGKNKQLMHIKSQLKILCSKLFHFDTFTCYDICIYRLNRLVHHMEKLQIKFAQVQGKRQADILKKHKIMSFCNHINLSLSEVNILKERTRSQKLFEYLDSQKLYRQLLKLKRKMLCILKMKTDWENLYLKQVKRYKTRANTISYYIQCLNGIKVEDNV